MYRAILVSFSALFLVLGVFLCLPAATLAQTAKGVDALEISVSPEAPAPGSSTTITLTSMSVDLSQATIAWTLDGQEKAAGVGFRTFTFTMGPAGKSTVVGVAITPARGSRITRTFTFRPGSVLLLWEADTYIPQNYPGRALYSAGATIRMLAVPTVLDDTGSPIPSSDLNFRWSLEGDAQADRSGLGRDLLLITGSQLRQQEEVGVEVLRRDGSKAAAATKIIGATTPFIRFYKVDPLRGTRYERNLAGQVTLTETETTVVAEPYFISGAPKNGTGFIRSWRLNGVEVQPEGRDQSVITLRQQGASGGSASLEFSVQYDSYKKLLQNASGAIELLLSSNSGSAF